MGFACEGGERRCYLGETGTNVGGHGPSSAAVVFVTCVGLRHGETEVALDPGQGRVAYPVRGDLLCRYPREMVAETSPEVVVAPGGDGLAVGVPEQALAERAAPGEIEGQPRVLAAAPRADGQSAKASRFCRTACARPQASTVPARVGGSVPPSRKAVAEAGRLVEGARRLYPGPPRPGSARSSRRNAKRSEHSASRLRARARRPRRNKRSFAGTEKSARLSSRPR